MYPTMKNTNRQNAMRGSKNMRFKIDMWIGGDTYLYTILSLYYLLIIIYHLHLVHLHLVHLVHLHLVAGSGCLRKWWPGARFGTRSMS